MPKAMSFHRFPSLGDEQLVDSLTMSIGIVARSALLLPEVQDRIQMLSQDSVEPQKVASPTHGQGKPNEA